MLAPIKIQPSRKLFWFTGFLYSGAGIAILLSGIFSYVKLGLLIILMFLAKNYFQRFVFLTHPKAVISFWQSQREFWSVALLNNEIKNVFIKSNSLITSFLLVLNFYSEDRQRITLIITAESIGQRQFRQLLVYLNHLDH